MDSVYSADEYKATPHPYETLHVRDSIGMAKARTPVGIFWHEKPYSDAERLIAEGRAFDEQKRHDLVEKAKKIPITTWK